MRDEGIGTSILLVTERLFLREMDMNDYDALYRVWQVPSELYDGMIFVTEAHPISINN